MALTESAPHNLGLRVPSFRLPDTEGKIHSLDEFPDAKAYVVMFICNHCPYVKHIADKLSEVTSNLMEQGAVVFGINSNDAQAYPADSPEMMKKEKLNRGYKFPYLYDETQKVARDFHAVCTPEFFVFDADQFLAYHGQFDDSRPGNQIPVTGQDLTAAVEAVLSGAKPDKNQKPSIGCSIKWKS